MTAQLPLQGKTILLARPASQTEGLRHKLQTLGAQCESLSLFDIAPVSADPARPLSEYDGLIFTSRNAVIHGPSLSDAPSNCLAVGAGTAEELRNRGIQDVTLPDESRSEGLLALPVLNSVAQQRWLIIKGRGGRQLLGRELSQRGAMVDNLLVYERRPISHDAGLIERYLSAMDFIIFFSGEGLQQLVEVCPGTFRNRLFDTQLVVPSTRVVKMAQDIGFKHSPCPAGSMSDDALTAALLKAADRVEPGETKPDEIN